MSQSLKNEATKTRRPRFALRTIKDGAVKIRGLVFRPEQRHRAYDGRLDGKRYLFGLYWGPPNYDRYGPDGWLRAFVSLWGSEEAARAQTDEEMAAMWPGPECVDGAFVWEVWRAHNGGDPARWRESPDQGTLLPAGEPDAGSS